MRVNVEKAITTVVKNYNYAIKQEYIKKPVAWALYQTWKVFDSYEDGTERN